MYPGAWVGAWYGDWFGDSEPGVGPTYADMAIQAFGSGSMSATADVGAVQVVSGGGGAPRRKRRKLWLLETDTETLVFDTEAEREQYINDVLIPRAPQKTVKRRVIKTRRPTEEVVAKVAPPIPFDPTPTDAQIEARVRALEVELQKARESWQRHLEIEDEELAWLL